jgi:hypothetical protein
MTLRGGHLSGIALLVAIQLATAFASIGLLTRMSPAVEEILAENVSSNEAAEQMVSSLGLALAGASGDHQATFRDAIRRARDNVTEPEEVPVIDRIDKAGQQFFAGDASALERAVVDARDLIRVNRAAMQRANDEAQRLGTAGAWAAVVLSLLGFLVSVMVVRRTILGIVEPIEELEAALVAFSAGDPYRRCQGRAASEEMRRVLRAVNTLLDRASRLEAQDTPR